MDYFWIQRDKRYSNLPRIRQFIIRYRASDFTVEGAHRIKDRNVVFVDSEMSLDYADVIDGQVFLISEGVKNVFQMYDPSISYKTFCLLNNVCMDLKMYYAPIMPISDGTDFSSDFNKKRDRRTLPALKQEYLKRPIMRIRELAPDGVIIRLDVAESLLRRGLYKMNLTRMVIESSVGEG